MLPGGVHDSARAGRSSQQPWSSRGSWKKYLSKLSRESFPRRAHAGHLKYYAVILGLLKGRRERTERYRSTFEEPHGLRDPLIKNILFEDCFLVDTSHGHRRVMRILRRMIRQEPTILKRCKSMY